MRNLKKDVIKKTEDNSTILKLYKTKCELSDKFLPKVTSKSTFENIKSKFHKNVSANNLLIISNKKNHKSNKKNIFFVENKIIKNKNVIKNKNLDIKKCK